MVEQGLRAWGKARLETRGRGWSARGRVDEPGERCEARTAVRGGREKRGDEGRRRAETAEAGSPSNGEADDVVLGEVSPQCHKSSPV